MKSFYLIGIVTLLNICLASITQAQNEDSTPVPRPPSSSGGSFLTRLMEPLKATLRKAREMLDSGVGSIHEGVDSARLQAFKVFMQIYNKTYSPEEIPKRMALFFKRRELIEESVKSFQEGRSMFVMRENDFIDWDDEELKKLTGVSMPNPEDLTKEQLEQLNSQQDTELASNKFKRSISEHDETGLRVKAQIPAQVDWRDSGCVAKPLNQLNCGCCYAVATIGVVEAMRCLKQVSAPTLSTQQIIDCSTPRAGYANYGCDGGWPTRVLKYLQEVKVVARESCYPFVRRQNTCRLRKMTSTEGCTVNASPTNSRRLSYKVLSNERDMLYHVATTGPLVGVLQASDKFLYYGRGIFDDRKCTRRRDDIDHAIQLVGYGSENGVDYWLIKNSYGTTTWGEGGYGKLRRGVNACSIGYFAWAVTA